MSGAECRWAMGGLVLALGAGGAAGIVRSIEFPRLNQTYRDLAPEIAPYSGGGLEVRLRSPANSVTVRSHRLEIDPLPDGSVRFLASASLLGKAQLVAELDAGGLPAELADEVVLPIQEVEVAGRAEVRRTAEGYEVLPRELPAHVVLAVQSRLAGQLVTWCDLSSILLPSLECGGLDQALSQVRLPLPAPGETYFVEASRLLPEEQATLDAALGEGPPPTAQ
ncbi:MAG: hypothetical protein ACRD0X_01770 [Thermoanaerobaculia bacterium]